MQRVCRPLFRLGAGWLYLAAGLVLCAAGVLVPAVAELNDLSDQLGQLHASEAISSQRLESYAEFIDALERDDPALLRRLAAAHLNVMPAGETPVLIASSADGTERQWIDATIEAPPVQSSAAATSLLGRLAGGRGRLWLLGAGAMSIFIGLLLDVLDHGSRRQGGAATRQAAMAMRMPARSVPARQRDRQRQRLAA